MVTESSVSYYESINKVIVYIDDNLANDLSLEALADVSGYSRFHFHRLFHALVGKSLLDYVNERRLTAAAGRLLYHSKEKITDIALECGFSNSGSFTRSFRRMYGCSPSNYRRSKTRKRPIVQEEYPLRQYTEDKNKDNIYRYEYHPNLYVAGIVTKGMSKSFESGEIEDAYRRLFAWLLARGQFHERTMVLGITMDTPEVVTLEECRYLACATVDETVKPEGEVFVREIQSAGDHICFTLDRTQPRFADKFFLYVDYLYGSYMPRFGLYPDDRPVLELYRQNGSAVDITLCVPVRKYER